MVKRIATLGSGSARRGQTPPGRVRPRLAGSDPAWSGGATLKDFAFALLIGIASGAYSSIFIAAPLLSLWKGHESQYRRRQATGIEKATLGTVAPGLAGGTGGGGSTATATVPRKKADALPESVPVPELSDEERAAREAARRRREERRRKQGRGHGRRT